ncbi:MAG: hypothetical protein GXO39_07115 [Thermotogae bacterium]|nr:hypothetical protein [Thermotogota bacterium]
MKRIGVLLFAGALLFAGCGKDVGTPSVVPTATNNGSDLELTWEPVENASSYIIYGEETKIAEIDSTHYILQGSEGVYSYVVIEAVGGGKDTVDLTPWVSDLGAIYTHDDPDTTHHSWVEVGFGDTIYAKTTNQAGVDTTKDAAYFVFYNGGSATDLYLKDIHQSSFEYGRVHSYFADVSTEYLAPNSTDRYSDNHNVSGNSKYFVWFDIDKDGSINTSDYFGVVELGPTSGTGPYESTIKIYVQDKVKGLGWIKW